MRGKGGRRATGRAPTVPAGGAPAPPATALLTTTLLTTALLTLSGCAGGAEASSGAAPAPLGATAPVVQPAPEPATSASPSEGPRGQGGRASRTLRRPDGSLRVVEVEQGFTVDLPRGFVRIPSQAALDAVLRGPAPVATRLRTALAAAAPGAPGPGRLLAVDPARGTVITVLTTPAGAADGADLAGQAGAIRGQLENALGTRVSVTTLRVDGEPAVRGQAQVRSGRAAVRLTDVYTVHAERFYTVAVGEAGRAEPALVPQLLASMHFLP